MHNRLPFKLIFFSQTAFLPVGQKFLLLLLVLVLFSCRKQEPAGLQPAPENEIRGADLSFLPKIEQAGTLFYRNDGSQTDALTIFQENGCNTVRVRLWHSPTDQHSALPEVIDFAQRIKQKGLKFYLDIHYSDTWADPAHQHKPAAWQGLPFSALTDSVFAYTLRVVQLLKPDYVQIGNEINHGFLWDEGRIANRDSFIALLNAGANAARQAHPTTQIMVHYAGFENSRYFWQLLKNSAVDYDIIALSYYPWWHGKDFNKLANSMNALTSEFEKPVFIAETAYPFSLSWSDYTHNMVGSTEQIIPDFPATPAGQRDFLLRLRQISRQCPNGLGFCYWAPEYIAFRSDTATNGSPWENLALFGFSHNALPAMQAFEE